MPAAINPEEIIHNLHELWDELDRQQSGTGGILKACAMTLVVTAESDQDSERVRRTLGVLMHEHPSRAVIVRDDAADGRRPEARVFAECWKPFGSAQQICSEGIEITAAHARFGDITGILAPLRVPDLPLVLWCRGPRAFSGGAFDPLYPLADKIIVDSAQASDPPAALEFLRSVRGRGYRVSDLHWTRLTGWREILSSLFDQGALCADDILEARIEYGGDTPSTCALYFLSWIRQALPNARIVPQSASGRRGLRSVTFSAPAGAVTFLHAESSMVEVSGLGRNYRCSLPPGDEESLMREELKILGPDPVYDRVLGK